MGDHDRMTPDDLAARLGEAGYVATVETFPARTAAASWFAAYTGLSVLAAALAYPLPLAGAVLGLVALVLHARDSDGRPLEIGWTGESHNVVARAPHAGTADLVVVTALAPVAPPRRGIVIALQVLMAAVPAGGAAAWIAEAGRELPVAIGVAAACAGIALTSLGLLLRRARPSTISAVEVLAGLAPLLRDQRVWLVAVGHDGIGALLDEHSRELAGASWLNLHAGGDEVVAVSEEGTWRERRADRALMGAAEEAGAEVRPYRFVPTLATPLLARRRRALTLLVPHDHDGRTVILATCHAALGESLPGAGQRRPGG